MAQGREVFARFVQDLRAAWGAVQEVESRMKQSAKLLEGLVSNPALRESSKTWRRWAKRGANGGDQRLFWIGQLCLRLGERGGDRPDRFARTLHGSPPSQGDRN